MLTGVLAGVQAVATGAASGVAPAGVGEVVVSGSLIVAIPLAVLAGLVSFASPCVLPLVPGYLSYVTGLSASELVSPGHGTGPGAAVALAPSPPTVRRSRVVVGTLGFVAGFAVVFVSYGALFGGLGATLLTHQDVLTRVLGVVVIVMGLGFLGLVPALQREARWHARPTRGVWGAPLLGALFGIGWTPCIGPTLAAVQGLAFTEASAARGALLSVAYCVGLGLPFLVVGLALERGMGAVAWARRHARAIQVAGGACLVGLGLLMVTGLWGSLAVAMRGWVSGWSVPL